MIVMAVDLGQVRTGIAVSDKGGIFAFPRDIIKERNREKLCEKIVETAKAENAERIVMGLPKNIDGSEGEKAEEIRSAKSLIESLTDIPIVLWDERYTTVLAHRSLAENGIKAKNRKDIVDSVAATVILEDYLKYIEKETTK